MGIERFVNAVAKYLTYDNVLKVWNSDNNGSSEKQIQPQVLCLDYNSNVYNIFPSILQKTNMYMSIALDQLFSIMNTANSNSKKNKGMNSWSNPIFKELNELHGLDLSSYEISTPEDIIKIFHEHFNGEYLDKLIIHGVVEYTKNIIRNCTDNNLIYLYIALDGVPSKGKMKEQKIRRNNGAVFKMYKSTLLGKYERDPDMLQNYNYYKFRYPIEWNSGKITPGTDFMSELAMKIQEEIINNDRFMFKKYFSGTNECGEAEMKIVRWIRSMSDVEVMSRDGSGVKNFSDLKLAFMSPDADCLILCLQLNMKDIIYFRSVREKNNTFEIFDIDKIRNIFTQFMNEDDNNTMRIVDDICFMFILFGNDFLPKIVSIDATDDIDTILKIYKRIRNGRFIVDDDRRSFNLDFLIEIYRELLPIENEFIKNNWMYNNYFKFRNVQKILSHRNINSKNIFTEINEFKDKYRKLSLSITNDNGSAINSFSYDKDFMESLTNAFLPASENNTNPIEWLENHYREKNSLPKLNLYTSRISTSSNNPQYQKELATKNNYQVEVFTFDKGLDDYTIVLNKFPIPLSNNDDITDFHNHNFHDGIGEATKKYMEGILWIFRYYYQSDFYMSNWYYPYHESPLLRDLVDYLSSSTGIKEVKNISLKQYFVDEKEEGLESYFNQLEQLIYVSAPTKETISILPKEIQDSWSCIHSQLLDIGIHIDIESVVAAISNAKENKKSCPKINCMNKSYIEKCNITNMVLPSIIHDKQYRELIRTYINSEDMEKYGSRYPGY